MAGVLNPRTEGLRPLKFGNMRGLMEQRCSGQHDIYVAEVMYVPSEGKLVVVTVCRNCDTVHFHERLVAQPHREAELLKKEK
jgi:hypothetical protein